MSYFDVIDRWERPAKLLEAMLPLVRENPGPLMRALEEYKAGANKAHSKWVGLLAENGIRKLDGKDTFRIPPFPDAKESA